jgi:hypothetical protein
VDGEEVDGVPVLARPGGVLRVQRLARGLARERSAGRSSAAALPAVQAAAVAAGGFVAGAAVVGLVHRRQRSSPALAGGGRAGRALARGAGRSASAGSDLLQIVGSRTLLVDVHLLGSAGDR